MIKLKEEDVIKRVKELHPALDFSKGLPYTNTTTRFLVICKVCGHKFETTFNSLLSGRGCKRCADNRLLVSNENFVERLKSLYKDRFSYEQTVYTGNRSKVEILCKKHNKTFQVLACTALKGKIGCEDCDKSRNIPRKLTMSMIIERLKSNDFYNNNYIYPSDENFCVRDKLEIVCKTHGPFKIGVNRLLRGSGCQKCAGNYLKSSEEVREDIENLIPNTYDTSLLEYKNNEEPFILKTLCCNKTRYATIDAVKKSPKCPYCNKTKNMISNTDVGYFYILKLNGLDLYKIGITSNFIDRFTTLQYNIIKSDKFLVFTTQEPYFLQKIEKDAKRMFKAGFDDLKETFSDGWTEVIDGKYLADLLTYLRSITCLKEEVYELF